MHERSPPDTAHTILVVEDEALVRMAISDYLRDCGYCVFEAGIVDEAIAILRSESRIDILFSDIQMPGGRTGVDLCRWTHANLPHVRVILTSGGMNAADLAEDLCHAGPLMGKPYHMHDVLARIRSILDQGVNLAATG